MKPKIFFSLLFALSVLNFSSWAQSAPAASKYSKFSLGAGFGLDYGGIGARATVFPSKYAFLFAGGGYNLVDFGYNVGGGIRFTPNKTTVPYLIGMYGYNTVLKVENIDFNKSYSGLSIGAGIELHSRSNYYSDIKLLVPIRSDEYKNDRTNLESIGVEWKMKPLPILISAGFHWEL